jgi:hypothetical protein
MAEDDDSDEDEGEARGIPLIEGMLLGRLLFPFAMAEAERVPPANDTEALPEPPPGG